MATSMTALVFEALFNPGQSAIRDTCPPEVKSVDEKTQKSKLRTASPVSKRAGLQYICTETGGY
jgi:hypothetical protein